MSVFNQYLMCIENVSAIEDLRAISVAHFGNPNLKKEARQKTIQELKKAVNQGIETQLARFQDVAKKLAQGMRRNG